MLSDGSGSARRITVRRYESSAEADRHDVEFWRQLSDAERVMQAWRLSLDLWRLRGDLPDEPRLFVDLLRAFIEAEVRFLVVGAYALALHGRPRATGDLDLWVDATPENAARVIRALETFGAPLQEISAEDFSREGVTYQLGVAPGRIDLLTQLTGLTFAEAWHDRIRRPFGEVEVDFIGRTSFIRNKRATGRPTDLADIEGLE
jgi:hypothetical protein